MIINPLQNDSGRICPELFYKTLLINNASYCCAPSCSVFLILVCSCERASFPESLLTRAGVPTEVQRDFFERSGSDIRITDAGYIPSSSGISYSSGERAYVHFVDRTGLSCKSEYLNGRWQLTLREYDCDEPTRHLPRPVANAFRLLDYEPYLPFRESDRVVEYTRQGFDHPDHYAQHYLLIDEQGSVLEDANSYFNCMDNSVNYGEALSFIAARYPGCDVRGLANDSGYDTFYIFHEGRLKRVRFENHFQVQYPTAAEGWKETVWRLDGPQEVPDYVWAEFQMRNEKTAENNRYQATDYFYLETLRDCYFGLGGPASSTILTISWYTDRG